MCLGPHTDTHHIKGRVSLVSSMCMKTPRGFLVLQNALLELVLGGVFMPLPSSYGLDGFQPWSSSFDNIDAQELTRWWEDRGHVIADWPPSGPLCIGLSWLPLHSGSVLPTIIGRLFSSSSSYYCLSGIRLCASDRNPITPLLFRLATVDPCFYQS